LKALRFFHGNVLIDYYIYRECIEVSSFLRTYRGGVFEGGLEGVGEGIDLDTGCFEKQCLVGSSSELDPYREGSRRDAAM
jgi:hypothetical protein